MQAARYHKNISPEEYHAELLLETVEKPEPKADEVLIKIELASINPIDTYVIQGFMKVWSMPLPFIPGYDVAGTVEAVGANVTNFTAGDNVFAVQWGKGSHDDQDGTPVGGAFAQYCVIPASKLSKIPSGLSKEIAAALPLVGTTAYDVINTCAKLKAGDKILILGGSSSVGSIAIQLAKLKGAWVATTSSSRTMEYVREFNPDLIINYNENKWEEHSEIQGLDFVFDTVGDTGAFERATKTSGLIKEGGGFCSISAFDAGFDPTAHAPALSYGAFYCLCNSAAVQDEIAQLVVEGKLRITIDEEFPFTKEGIVNLFNKVGAKKSIGKNILRIA